MRWRIRKNKPDKINDNEIIYNTGDSTPEEMFGDDKTCKNCGFVCKGYFCKKCGEKLDEDLDEINKWLYKGINLQFTQEYEKAILYFDDHIKLNPKDPYGYYYKGECLAALGNHNDAIIWYNKISEINQEFTLQNSNYSWRIAQSYFALKKYQEALSYNSKALELFPQHRLAQLLQTTIQDTIEESS